MTHGGRECGGPRCAQRRGQRWRVRGWRSGARQGGAGAGARAEGGCTGAGLFAAHSRLDCAGCCTGHDLGQWFVDGCGLQCAGWPDAAKQCISCTQPRLPHYAALPATCPPHRPPDPCRLPSAWRWRMELLAALGASRSALTNVRGRGPVGERGIGRRLRCGRGHAAQGPGACCTGCRPHSARFTRRCPCLRPRVQVRVTYQASGGAGEAATLAQVGWKGRLLVWWAERLLCAIRRHGAHCSGPTVCPCPALPCAHGRRRCRPTRTGGAASQLRLARQRRRLPAVAAAGPACRSWALPAWLSWARCRPQGGRGGHGVRAVSGVRHRAAKPEGRTDAGREHVRQAWQGDGWTSCAAGGGMGTCAEGRP